MTERSPGSRTSGDHSAAIVYDTRYGNTKKIAEALELGLKETGIQTFCVNTKDIKADALKQYDLICIGAPTEAFSASKPMKEFLGSLMGVDLTGKYGFAFDTKVDWRFSGSAGKFIEKILSKSGLQTIMPRQSAIVISTRENGPTSGAYIKDGEEAKFKAIGKQVGIALLARGNVISA